MAAWKLTQIGNSVGAILPRELLAPMKVDKGDLLHVTDSPDGITLTPYDPGMEAELAEGRDFMREYRDTVRARQVSWRLRRHIQPR